MVSGEQCRRRGSEECDPPRRADTRMLSFVGARLPRSFPLILRLLSAYYLLKLPTATKQADDLTRWHLRFAKQSTGFRSLPQVAGASQHPQIGKSEDGTEEQPLR